MDISKLHIIKFHFPSLPLFDYKVETQIAGEDAGCWRPLKSMNNFEAISNLKPLNNFEAIKTLKSLNNYEAISN